MDLTYERAYPFMFQPKHRLPRIQSGVIVTPKVWPEPRWYDKTVVSSIDGREVMVFDVYQPRHKRPPVVRPIHSNS